MKKPPKNPPKCSPNAPQKLGSAFSSVPAINVVFALVLVLRAGFSSEGFKNTREALKDLQKWYIKSNES